MQPPISGYRHYWRESGQAAPLYWVPCCRPHIYLYEYKLYHWWRNYAQHRSAKKWVHVPAIQGLVTDKIEALSGLAVQICWIPCQKSPCQLYRHLATNEEYVILSGCYYAHFILNKSRIGIIFAPKVKITLVHSYKYEKISNIERNSNCPPRYFWVFPSPEKHYCYISLHYSVPPHYDLSIHIFLT